MTEISYPVSAYGWYRSYIPLVDVYLPNGFVSVPLALSCRPWASVFT